MTAKLNPKVKAQNAKLRNEKKEQEDKIKRVELNALLRQHGNAFRVAIALGVSNSAVYEKMARLGIEIDKGSKNPKQEKATLQAVILQFKTAKKVAEALGISTKELSERMKAVNLKFKS